MNDEDMAKLRAEKVELQAKVSQLEEARAQIKDNLSAPTHNLDGDDKLRLENIILRERLMERDKEDARQSFYNHLINKYKVDSSRFNIAVDAQASTLTLQHK